MAVQIYDKHGRPIYPGDLLKSFHFVGARRKRYYLYHVVTAPPERRGSMFPLWMVPTSHLEPTKRSGGGCCPLTPEMVEDSEIIAGFGGPGNLDYEDRPKRTLDTPA